MSMESDVGRRNKRPTLNVQRRMSNSEILDRGNRFAHMVERVVLNALAMKRAYRLIIRAFGEA